MEVGAFTLEEVAAMAAGAGVVLSERAAERLQRHTRGHALHVLRLLVGVPGRRPPHLDQLAAR